MKTKIAIYGGSFNPIHMGHKYAVEYVLSTGKVDVAWVMPCWKHPFNKEMVDFNHRMNMCRLTFRTARSYDLDTYYSNDYTPDGRIYVSDLEKVVNDPVGLTADVLTKIHAIHGNDFEFYIALGSDLQQLAESGGWEKWDEMVAIAKPLIIPRLGYVDHSLGPKISSTEIKRLLKNKAEHHEFNGLIDERVLDYIKKHNLYR
jgi:nicotinate-nucleotide adenylyltransferase